MVVNTIKCSGFLQEPRHRPIWTICMYIPFESPWPTNFRNARLEILACNDTSLPVASLIHSLILRYYINITTLKHFRFQAKIVIKSGLHQYWFRYHMWKHKTPRIIRPLYQKMITPRKNLDLHNCLVSACLLWIELTRH